MRINFADTTRAKFVAKQVRDVLDLIRDPALPKIPLSAAQDIVARMFGYRDWHELDQVSGTVAPSPHDEDCHPLVERKRRAYQARALTIEGVFAEEGRLATEVLMPSARRPGKASTYAAYPARSVSSLSVANIDMLDLRGMKAGDMIVMYKAEKVFARSFTSDAPMAFQA